MLLIETFVVNWGHAVGRLVVWL